MEKAQKLVQLDGVFVLRMIKDEFWAGDCLQVRGCHKEPP
jgi:hypothetical protein